MPNWNQILEEVTAANSAASDIVRRKYLNSLFNHTGRNVIAYYSGWLQKLGPEKSLVDFGLNDTDKTGFMTTMSKLNRSKGLDLILHTPGGEVAATESLVDYIREMFGNNFRVIIPQLAMSAGTMMACASREIVMGKQSSIGPIDPQVNGMPAQGIMDEVTQAREEIQKYGQPAAVIWTPILSSYHPTFINSCRLAIEWSSELVEGWLSTGMLKDHENVAELAKSITETLGDANTHKAHNRHISKKVAADIGLVVTNLEDDDTFQDIVLSIHHCMTITMTMTSAYKIIENHIGTAFIQKVKTA